MKNSESLTFWKIISNNTHYQVFPKQNTAKKIILIEVPFLLGRLLFKA